MEHELHPLAQSSKRWAKLILAAAIATAATIGAYTQATAASSRPPPPVVEPHCFGSADAAAYWLSSAPRPDCASSAEREAPLRPQPGNAPSIRSIEGSVEDIVPRPEVESGR